MRKQISLMTSVEVQYHPGHKYPITPRDTQSLTHAHPKCVKTKPFEKQRFKPQVSAAFGLKLLKTNADGINLKESLQRRSARPLQKNSRGFLGPGRVRLLLRLSEEVKDLRRHMNHANSCSYLSGLSASITKIDIRNGRPAAPIYVYLPRRRLISAFVFQYRTFGCGPWPIRATRVQKVEYFGATLWKSLCV